MAKLKKINFGNIYVIAEIGMNHNGSFALAGQLISQAATAGVDAVKFQMHIAETETLKNALRPPFFKNEDRFSFFKRTAFNYNQWQKLKTIAKRKGLDFIVSPFSVQAAVTLNKLKIDAYKIASGEVTNLPLLEYVKKTKLPVILSTGMANWREINQAIKSLGGPQVIMQCSSQYPCLPKAVGLNVIGQMSKKYPQALIGFSDHTLSNVSSIAALVLGAKVFEKHFTRKKSDYGPDARFSLEPDQLKDYVDGLKFIELALENPVDKNSLQSYHTMKQVFEKSLVAARDLKKGAVIKFSDLEFLKPGDGIRVDQYKKIVGRKLLKNLIKHEKLNYDHFH